MRVPSGAGRSGSPPAPRCRRARRLLPAARDGGCRGVELGDVADELVAAAERRADEALRRTGVAHRAARRLQTTGERRLADEAVAPHGIEQLVLGHHTLRGCARGGPARRTPGVPHGPVRLGVAARTARGRARSRRTTSAAPGSPSPPPPSTEFAPAPPSGHSASRTAIWSPTFSMGRWSGWRDDWLAGSGSVGGGRGARSGPFVRETMSPTLGSWTERGTTTSKSTEGARLGAFGRFLRRGDGFGGRRESGTISRTTVTRSPSGSGRDRSG